MLWCLNGVDLISTLVHEFASRRPCGRAGHVDTRLPPRSELIRGIAVLPI